MKSKSILLVLLSFIILVSFASAQIQVEQYSTGFSVSHLNPVPSLCLYSSFNDEFLLKNTAAYPQVFQIEVTSPRAQLGVSELTILPGEEMVVPVVFSASCSDSVGTEVYDLIIRSTTGDEKTITRALSVFECQTINATLFSNKNTSSICSEVSYSLKLSNPSTFTEDYLIGPLNNVEFFDVSGYSVSLLPGQISVLNFSFTPACDISGDIENTFRVEANKSKLEAELSHNLFIEPGYDFVVFGADDLNLCRFERLSQEYIITNNGLTNNTYDLSLKNNPRFVSLNESIITLEPGESSSVSLLFEPELKVKDSYSFDLVAHASVGDVQVVKSINLSFSNCFDVEFGIVSPSNMDVCAGEQSLDVLIKNNGLFEENFTLKTNTKSAMFSDDFITLEPGEEKIVDLIISSHNFSGEILFVVEAHSTRDLLKYWSDSIVLDIVSSRDCSKIFFPKKYFVYSRIYEENVSLTVKNIGVEGDYFDIAYKGSDFLQLVNRSVFIPAGESFEIILNKTRPHDFDEYFFNISLTSSSGEMYSKEFKLILTTTPLFAQLVDYARDSPCFIITTSLLFLSFIFLLSLLLFGAIFSRKVKIILSSILIVSAIVLLIIMGLPERINPSLDESANPYEFNIYEGEKLKIDLEDYVLDPDNDTLIFSVIDEPKNLSLSLDNGVITISSEGFIGSDRFRVHADDGLGGDIITPRFNINVFERKSLSFFELYEFYCVHLNIVLLILLALFVFFSKSKTRNKSSKSKKRNVKESVKSADAKKSVSEQSKKLTSSKSSALKKSSSKKNLKTQKKNLSKK